MDIIPKPLNNLNTENKISITNKAVLDPVKKKLKIHKQRMAGSGLKTPIKFLFSSLEMREPIFVESTYNIVCSALRNYQQKSRNLYWIILVEDMKNGTIRLERVR